VQGQEIKFKIKKKNYQPISNHKEMRKNDLMQSSTAVGRQRYQVGLKLWTTKDARTELH
jgi:hypothetical protein